MGEDVADAEGGAADGGDDPKGLLGFGGEVVAEEEAGAVGGDVAEGRAGDFSGEIEGGDGATGEGDGGEHGVAVVDSGGEEVDAVGGDGGEVLHVFDGGGEMAVVGDLGDVRRGDGRTRRTEDEAGDAGGADRDGGDGPEVVGAVAGGWRGQRHGKTHPRRR